MIKQFFLVALLFLFVFVSKSQFSTEEWHEGYIVTTEKDTITGLVNYDMEANIVQVSRKKNVKAFSSYKVFYFEIFDKIRQNYRQFYTLPYALKTSYKTPIIFEVLYEGNLSLLAREKIVQEVANNNAQAWSNVRVVQPRIDHDFYFVDRKGNITYYNGQRSDLLRILSDKRGEVKDFIKENKLKPNLMRDLIRITSFYNSI